MDINCTINVTRSGATVFASNSTLTVATQAQADYVAAKSDDMLRYARRLGGQSDGDCTVSISFGAAPTVVEKVKRSDVVHLLAHVADEWVGNGIKG